jgi:hypothetical protein
MRPCHRLRALFALSGLAVAATGCDRCSGNLPAELQNPPDTVVIEKVTAHVKTDKEIIKTICGVAATGLKDVVVKPARFSPKIVGAGYVNVEGAPVGVTAPAKGSGSAPASPPAKCTAELRYKLVPVLSKDRAITGWAIEAVSVWAVSTAGVSFTRPNSGGGDWDD